MKSRRMIAVAAVALGLTFVGVGSATAGSFTHSTTGASIKGYYKFEPRSIKQGAFHFYGTLNDTLDDGNAVKLQVRVQSYPYNTYYTGVDSDRYLSKYVWDGAALQTNKARAKVCRDRGSLHPDNCSAEKTYTR